MIIQIFDYPSGEAFIDNFKRGDITDCKSYEYEKHFDAPGTFTAEIPATSIFVGAIKINSILIVDNQDFLIVKNIKETHDNVTVTGYDLKGLLVDRRTLYGAETVNGVEGYDAIKDVSTETILHHYIENNAVAPDDEKRIIPALHLAEDKERGIESDRYMARLENLSELVTTLCKNASIGYDITVTSGNLKPFEFNVLEMVDKTDSQSERNRVVFAIDRKNVATIEREVGVTADKNAFYIEAADTVTLQYHTEDEPAGIDRREEFLQLNCELDEVEIYTAKETEDYGKTDSLTVTAGDPQNYGTMYELGDIVTVKYRGAILDSPIVSVLKKWSGTEYSIEITLGNSKPKLLDGFATKAEQNSKVQRNKAAGGGSAGIGIRAAYGVALTASTTKQPLISIAYSATSTAYVSYHATLIFNVTTAGAIKFVLEQDSRVVQEYVQSYNTGLNFCAITYALTATNGAHTAVLGVVSEGGIATFEAGKSQAHILSGDISKEIPWDGTISAAEKMPCIAFGAPSMSPLSYTAAPTISKPTPINQIITAAMPAIGFGELSATIPTITDSLIMQGQTANYTDYTTVVVTFKNPVYADGGVLALSAWSIYGAISGVPTAIDITAYAISADGKKITFTTANFAGYDSGVFVSYDEVGNLRNSLDNTAVTGFIVSMIKT